VRRRRQVIFNIERHYLGGILQDGDAEIASALDVLGEPLIMHNLLKLSSRVGEITRVMLPECSRRTLAIVERELPSIQVEEYGDSGRFEDHEDVLRLPLNSAVLESEGGGVVVRQIVYPWDLLNVMSQILSTEVKETRISKNASISQTSVISGPCFISDSCYVDDFAKIRGPTYIGPGSKIGTNALVRESMIGPDSDVGFGCEVGRSYLVGNDRIAHHDVILDTLMGRNSWMGAFVGTTNVLLNNKNVRYKVGEQLFDTGLQHFGAVIGHDSALGASVIILPGRFIPPGSVVQAGTIFSDDLGSRHQ
jgi:acetyltransferase-like isoleucine patch superfamily enzyme